jgi:hypothetical protein
LRYWRRRGNCQHGRRPIQILKTSFVYSTDKKEKFPGKTFQTLFKSLKIKIFLFSLHPREQATPSKGE